VIRLVAVLLLLNGPAWAQTPVQVDPRIRTITYDANQVVRLQVPTNFHSAVIFGPNERVENVALGDSDGWQATLNQAGDALFIKPLRPGGSTNMTVITDSRVYSFELSSAYGPNPDAPFTVRFQYPESFSPTVADPAQPRLGSYRLSGSRSLRPVAVADDGVRTSIEWRSTQAIPAIFALDDRGAETLVEGHVRDGLYVIDAVHPVLIFRFDGQSARAVRLRPRIRR
jgi:type IV secretion system protein VirB9